MAEFYYRDPKKVNSEKKYLDYILNETRERTKRHRICLRYLGINVEEKVCRTDPTVVKYYNRAYKNVKTINNLGDYSEVEKSGSSELIPSERTIELEDGRTIAIKDDFECAKSEPNREFVTLVYVYNTSDIEKGTYKAVVTGVSHVSEDNEEQEMEIIADNVYMRLSDDSFTFSISEDRRERRIDFDGELALYSEMIIGNGNDQYSGTVGFEREGDTYFLEAGHGINMPKEMVTKEKAIEQSMGIVTSERVKELIEKAIQMVEKALGRNNKFRACILNGFRNVDYALKEDNSYKDADVEELVDSIKDSRLDFGNDNSVFVKAPIEILILD